MLWVKSLHVIFMVSWYAGLFYLPRLFVYHALTTDAPGNERFKVMERKLYYGIMAPSAVLTVVSGAWLWLGFGITGGHVIGAALVAQPRVLGSDHRVIQAGRYGVSQRDLAVLVLQEIAVGAL